MNTSSVAPPSGARPANCERSGVAERAALERPRAQEDVVDLIPEDVLDLRPSIHNAVKTVAVLGLGYVGLPTVMSLGRAGCSVIGIDPDGRRLDCIRAGDFDGPAALQAEIESLLAEGTLGLAADTSDLGVADGVVICVPTPVTRERVPDLNAIRGACASVVERARVGQTIVLTSTTYPGCTRELLVEPLNGRGLRVGIDIHVAFSPERIDPGNSVYTPDVVPRIVGGHTTRCTGAAAELLAPTAGRLHRVASTDVAEFAKLFENVFRAVNIALANELSDAAEGFGLDPVAVIEAAATKPYGFMRFDPGPGVGGHCIPVDPHYLLACSAQRGLDLPLVREAMQRVDERPRAVAKRVFAALRCQPDRPARVLVVGAAYKAGVADVRESPAIEIMRLLCAAGIEVSCHDPVVASARQLPVGVRHISDTPATSDYDLCLVLTMHPGCDYEWLESAQATIDMTYGRRSRAGAPCQ